MRLRILCMGAHPDDVELACGGTLLSHIASGKTAGIVDLTYGDLGTRGTVEIRKEEAAAAADILGASVRENLGYKDGFFLNDKEHKAFHEVHEPEKEINFEKKFKDPEGNIFDISNF